MSAAFSTDGHRIVTASTDLSANCGTRDWKLALAEALDSPSVENRRNETALSELPRLKSEGRIS
jgi:hypothetical protein